MNYSYFSSLQNLKYLEVIDLSNQEICYSTNFCNSLKSLTQVKELYLENCHISQSMADELGRSLKHFKLKILKLGMNPYMNNGFIFLIKCIQNSAESLKEFSFDINNIEKNQVTSLCGYLKHFTFLKDLTMTCQERSVDTSQDKVDVIEDTIQLALPECKYHLVIFTTD